MLKEWKSILSLVLVSLLLCVTPTLAAPTVMLKPMLTGIYQSSFIIGNYNATIHGATVTMDIAPYIKDTHTFIPIRYIACALGIDNSNIIWDGASNTVTLLKDSKVVQLRIGNKTLLINGAVVTMDAAPETASNHTMLPANYVAQAFGATVTWLPESQTVTISDTQPSHPSPPNSSKTIMPSQSINNPPNNDEAIVPYEWDYKTEHWKWEPTFSTSFVNGLLPLYRKMPHPHDSYQDYITIYCINTTPTEKDFLQEIVKCIKEESINCGYNEFDVIGNVAALVQSFTYISDQASTGLDEYPRYPLETLFSRGGDCEDTAILTATLIRELGYGTALIMFTDHCAVGIEGSDTFSGTYYTLDGVRYFYLETTSKGWEIGHITDDYKNQNAVVLPLP